jgi:ubiquinone/menaquinone biosynthesis C-methylase UbiE
MKASYDPKNYWLSRGKIYKDQFNYDAGKQLQEEVLSEYLKSLGHLSSVLEVGCGFGRITKLILSEFPEIKEYVATDLSPDQITNAKDYVKSDKVRFIESDIQSLDLPVKHFDLVIAAEVLLHIMPTDIHSVVSKLVSFSRKHVINIDYYEERSMKPLAAHNFLHQYMEIYKNISEVKEVRRIPIVRGELSSKLDTKQSIFHAMA